MPFVIDQAWGPHLRFCSALPLDAMTAGADAMVASTHKLISGITQSSVLVARGERLNLQRLESMVKMTQSTSPQVLMYASIDAARAQMATHGEELWSRAVENAEWARAQLAQIAGVRCLGDEMLARDGVADFDRTRLTVSACDLGLTGYELETVLRDDYGIAVEAADPLNVRAQRDLRRLARRRRPLHRAPWPTSPSRAARRGRRLVRRRRSRAGRASRARS